MAISNFHLALSCRLLNPLAASPANSTVVVSVTHSPISPSILEMKNAAVIEFEFCGTNAGREVASLDEEAGTTALSEREKNSDMSDM